MCTCLLTHGCLPPRKKTKWTFVKTTCCSWMNTCASLILTYSHVLFWRTVLILIYYFTLANLSIRKRIFYIHNFGQQVMTLVNIPFFDVLGKTNCLTSFLAPCKGFYSICELFCLRSATILCVRTSRRIKYCPELSPHTYWPQRKMVREEEWREIFSASSMRLPFFYSKL